MSGRRLPHPSHEEIDRYVRGQLNADDERRLEEHFLECPPCEGQVHALLNVVEALGAPATRPRWKVVVRRWQAAAALLALLAVIASWQWGRLAFRSEDPATGISSGLAPTIAGGVISVALSPPLRSSGRREVAIGAKTSVVVFSIDVREAAAPESPVVLSLHDAGGRVVLTANTTSTAEGTVRLPVDAAMLPAGAFQFNATAKDNAIGVPFVVRRSP